MGKTLNTAYLLLLPLAVAGWNLGLPAAAGLLLLGLAWRWAVTAAGLGRKSRGAEICLEAISASHFVEKVRWCLDRLGLDYTERRAGGTLGAVFLGRTVPRMTFRSGAVTSRIGNSSHILRYLWGRYGHQADAAFLEPTAEAVALEKRLDHYGVDLQVWIYTHLLPNRKLTLHAWGMHDPAVPLWQRWLLPVVFPLAALMVRRGFRISPASYQKSRQRIGELLAELDQTIGPDAGFLLGGELPSYVDFTFAALSSLWAQPEGFALGRSAAAIPSADQTPEGMAMDQAEWSRGYPNVVALIERLYRDYRAPATPSRSS